MSTNNLGFNPIANSKTFVQELQDEAQWLYDRALDANGDGLASILYRVSVGSGRGSAKIKIFGEDLDAVATAFEAFDLNEDEDVSSVAPDEAIRRTIRVEGEYVLFKTSLEKNTRNVKIPAKEWKGFQTLMRANAESVPAAIAYYRAICSEAEANDKANDKADVDADVEARTEAKTEAKS